jgi:hypothetical protein
VEPAEVSELVYGLKEQAAELGVPMDVPWREMPEAARETVLRGKG